MKDVLVQSSLYIDGSSYAGRVIEITPPKLALKAQEYKAGGMLSAVDIPNGEIEKMEASFVLGVQDSEVLTRFSLIQGSKVALTIRGATVGQDGAAKPVIINMTGTITEIDDGSWKGGEEVTQTISLTLTYYKRQFDGQTLIEFDVVNMLAMVNGVDQLAGIRSALGLA